jgi:hypothetical protein
VSQKHLRFLVEAQEEINSAFDWYFQRSLRTADAFLAEIGLFGTDCF